MNGFIEPPPRLWRHDQGAMLAGVCAGLAEDLDLPLPMVRLVSLLFLLLPTGLAYVALGVLLRRRPAMTSAFRPAVSAARPVAGRPGASRPASARTGPDPGPLPPHQDWALLRHRFAALEPRINRIESVVTAEDFELHRDFRRMEP